MSVVSRTGVSPFFPGEWRVLNRVLRLDACGPVGVDEMRKKHDRIDPGMGALLLFPNEILGGLESLQGFFPETFLGKTDSLENPDEELGMMFQKLERTAVNRRSSACHPFLQFLEPLAQVVG